LGSADLLVEDSEEMTQMSLERHTSHC
jgi:hypothetical protein